jgi:DNA-directed RNA polymerase beta subunit
LIDVYSSVEQLSKNRIIVELDSKNQVGCSVTSSTLERKSKTNIMTKNNKYYLTHNSFTEPISISIVLKAMGIISDQEIIQLIGTEYSSLLAASLQEAAEHSINTELKALEFIGNRIRESNASSKYSSSLTNRYKKLKSDIARDCLSSMILNHIPVVNYNFLSKANYLSLMQRRVCMAELDRSTLDDKDYYGNKRLEMAGSLLSLLFEDLFKRFNYELSRSADSVLSKPNRAAQFDIVKSIRQDTITLGLINSIATGNWTVKRFRMEKQGITQVLSRMSFIACLGMMTRINSQFEKTRKVSGPRSLQPSQWGMLCPSDTPEGESCGLVKNLSLMTHVTSDHAELIIIRLLFNLGCIDIDLCCGLEMNDSSNSFVLINGRLIGLHNNANFLINSVRSLRRAGLISSFISIYSNEIHRTIYIATDGGRVCRPLIIVKKSVPALTHQHIEKLKRGLYNFDSLLKLGIIEYLDVNEENDSNIAISPALINANTTHLEIDPSTILGVVAGLIAYPHHNQSPRNTYQCLSVDHEILTQQGWKSIDSIERGEEVLTINVTTGCQEWNKVTVGTMSKDFHELVNKFPYSGPLYQLNNESIDAVCNPQHNWLLNNSANSMPWQFHSVDQINSNQFQPAEYQIPLTGINSNPLYLFPQCSFLPPQLSAQLQFNLNFCRFTGYVLANAATASHNQPKQIPVRHATVQGKTYFSNLLLELQADLPQVFACCAADDYTIYSAAMVEFYEALLSARNEAAAPQSKSWLFCLSLQQAKSMIQGFTAAECDNSHERTYVGYVDSLSSINSISILALLCHSRAEIVNISSAAVGSRWRVAFHLNSTQLFAPLPQPLLLSSHSSHNGFLYCLTLPNGNFCTRRKCSWEGRVRGIAHTFFTGNCAMGKQAMGAIAYNQFNRIDSMLYLLCYPQRPMVKTKTIEMIGFEQLPAGVNAIIAVMSYSGYDIEDATILNKASLDRGFGRCQVLKKTAATIKRYPNQTLDRIIQPPDEVIKANFTLNNKSFSTEADTIKLGNKKYSGLDIDGICRVGERIESGEILINKQQPLNTSDTVVNPLNLTDLQYKSSPLAYKGPEASYVDKVLLSSNESDHFMIKVLMRSTRRPELGDKFSSRHGQKGVCM